ncbi:PDR/VanB family oxidoreductase [Nevskia soli]|uniref:PDR/VanB family oxidoreductase n=1 Tax=Nevskia soli TaxID=418856 RepID=UPI0004A6BC4A|nr:PDR/VanB family oxidoreductase [Nevskia soli]
MLDVVIARKEREAEGVFSFELKHASGGELPAFDAGSHVDVVVGPGLVRQYSLCNSPAERHRYVIGVLKTPDSRGGSKGLHERFEVGHRLQISEPRNLFPLESAGESLLFAGGIGITPILCMADSLCRQGRPFRLFYFTRDAGRAAFRTQMETAPYREHCRFQFDDSPAQDKLDVKQLLKGPERDKHLYICGPGGFMDYILDTARAQGWHETNLHREYFSAAAVSGNDELFEVQVGAQGPVYAVPQGRSVVDVLREAGIDIAVSCEQGICGTCVTRVIDGIPDHRDLYLSDAEKAANDQFTPCCSRARSARLVIEP